MLFRKEILNYQVKTTGGKLNYINLDNAATTAPLKAVEETVKEYINSYGSVHRGSGEKSKVSTDQYEQARETIKTFVNAPKSSYVIFTNNTTGGINTAAHFFAQIQGKIMVSSIEHSSSWLPWVKSEGEKAMGSKQYTLNEMDDVNERIQNLGLKNVITYDVTNNLEFDIDNIEKQLKQNKVKLLVLTAASNLTGYSPDIKKIGKLAHKYGAYFLVDGCQFIQHHKIDMKEMCIDFLVASGHKFYAPYGGGFLIGPKDFFDKFLPYQIGGGNLPYIEKNGHFIRYHNQLAHDPGTPNAIGAISMAAALIKLSKIGIENIEQYEQSLTSYVFENIKNNKNIYLYVEDKNLSTTIVFNIKGLSAQETAQKLNDIYGVGVRAGNFCVYNVVRKLLNIIDEKPLLKLVNNNQSHKLPGVVRASFSIQNTLDDAKRLVKALNELSKKD